MAQAPRSQDMSLFIGILGNVSLVLLAITVTVMLLPFGVVRKYKIVRKFRSFVVRNLKRLAALSAQGPFYRLFVHIGRKFAFGRLASRCSSPTLLRAKPAGCNEVTVSFTTNLPMNPFHEETYVIAWRKQSGTSWIEREPEKSDYEDLVGRLRVLSERLPENAPLQFRVCAMSIWGRSAWSDEASVETFAKPSDDGGFVGPLGPAAGEQKQYQWWQTMNEVHMKVPIPADMKAKDVFFKALPKSLEIRRKGASADCDALLVGPLPKKIKCDEANWYLEDNAEEGRYLSVQFRKAELMEKWHCLIDAKGHPCIDIRFVRLFPGGLGGGIGPDIFE